MGANGRRCGRRWRDRRARRRRRGRRPPSEAGAPPSMTQFPRVGAFHTRCTGGDGPRAQLDSVRPLPGHHRSTCARPSSSSVPARGPPAPTRRLAPLDHRRRRRSRRGTWRRSRAWTARGRATSRTTRSHVWRRRGADRGRRLARHRRSTTTGPPPVSTGRDGVHAVPHDHSHSSRCRMLVESIRCAGDPLLDRRADLGLRWRAHPAVTAMRVRCVAGATTSTMSPVRLDRPAPVTSTWRRSPDADSARSGGSGRACSAGSGR